MHFVSWPQEPKASKELSKTEVNTYTHHYPLAYHYHNKIFKICSEHNIVYWYEFSYNLQLAMSTTYAYHWTKFKLLYNSTLW